MNARLTRPLLLITVVLVVPVAVLALHGEAFTGWLGRWQDDPPPRHMLALAVVGILAADILLPVPSGPVITLAGSELGVALGATAAFAGMTLGSCLAFGLARRWGRPLGERLSTSQQLAEVRTVSERHGLWLLVITRPIPLVAEAAVLLAGILQYPWQNFIAPVLGANLGIALAYAVIGSQAASHGWLLGALYAAVILPLMSSAMWRKRYSR